MIYNTDCLKFLETIPDSSYDVCISSPPYNLGVRYSEYKDTRSYYIEWMKDVWYEVCRVLKPDGHLFLNLGYSKDNPFDTYKVAENVPWSLQNNIIWAKAVEVDGRVRGYSIHHSSKRYLQNVWEHLFHFTKNGDTPIDIEWSGVPYNENYNNAERNAKRSGKNYRATTNCWHITYKSKATKEITKEIAGHNKHPAIYPETLVEKCLKVSGLKNGVVFDPFMGTGTAAVAAIKQKWDYIGYEIDPDYVEFSKNRIPLTVA